MRVCARLLANPSSVGLSNGLKPAPLALLPPIPLYRRLFRAHRKHLDRKFRLLGDEYVKSEFRAHRNVENPMHIVRPPLPCAAAHPLEENQKPKSLVVERAYQDPLIWVSSTDRVPDRVANVCTEY